MIQLKDILLPQYIAVNSVVTSKKRALELIAKLIVKDEANLDEIEVFEQLFARERLGSTGFGHGVAIPHCRMESCQSPRAALIKLVTAIDFDAVDNTPVDLMIGLVVPVEATEEHLQLLKQAAGILNSTKVCKAIRDTSDSQAIYNIVMDKLSIV